MSIELRKEIVLIYLVKYVEPSEDNIEIHHLKRLKDTKDKYTLIKVMSTMRRKTIPLSMVCHDKVHAGKYDGLRLREIKNTL
jgi:predicted HNH restriction endonuclease